MALDIAKMRELRERRKLTQAAAADKAGMANRQHWNEIESGRRSAITLETLDRIAAALGVKAKELLK